MKNGELQDGVFDTHALPEDDIFSASECRILSDLPRSFLARKEDGFGSTKRALQELASFVLRWQARPSEIKAAFAAELRRSGNKGDVSPTTNARIADAIAICIEPEVPRALRLRAMTTLGILWLQIHPDHYTRVKRLELARISARPADASEVAAWLAGKAKIVTSPDFALPTSSGVLVGLTGPKKRSGEVLPRPARPPAPPAKVPNSLAAIAKAPATGAKNTHHDNDETTSTTPTDDVAHERSKPRARQRPRHAEPEPLARLILSRLRAVFALFSVASGFFYPSELVSEEL